MGAKNAPFTLGSSLDRGGTWQLERAMETPKHLEIKLPEKHLLVLKMEKRLGKPVSIVGPFFLTKEEMVTLCSAMKKKLGSGGTCKEEWMEFQGECRDKIKAFLETQRFRFKA